MLTIAALLLVLLTSYVAADGTSAARSECYVGGCSDTLCLPSSKSPEFSTCEWIEYYSCFQGKQELCKKDSDGECRWIVGDDSDFVSCLTSKGAPASVLSSISSPSATAKPGNTFTANVPASSSSLFAFTFTMSPTSSPSASATNSPAAKSSSLTLSPSIVLLFSLVLISLYA
jgi:hypothetical protein